MITLVVSLYDKKSQTFKQPFFVVRIEVATRALAGAVNNPARDNDVGQYPEDFSLYQLGSFNDETAQFTLLAQPLFVAEALYFKKAGELVGQNLSDLSIPRESN